MARKELRLTHTHLCPKRHAVSRGGGAFAGLTTLSRNTFEGGGGFYG